VPEGDTVYLTCRRLHAALAGTMLTTFDLRVPHLALADAVGSSMVEVVPVGKHILMRLSDGRTLRSHLRMDGAWRIGAAASPPRGRLFEIRALVGNERSLAAGVLVHDLALVPTSEESGLIGHLGPDLMDPDYDLDEALRRFTAEPDRAIGDALLDQRLAAGIGNVYKSELLFLHRLDPWQPVASVADLAAVLIDAARLLRANATTHDRTTTGWRQPGQQYYVYGRWNKACRRCGARIIRTFQGERGEDRVVYFCSACQHVPPAKAEPSGAGGGR
jgi:endonuclease-8